MVSHNIWLRDHCRCSECFHPVTKQRLVNTFDIPADIAPLSVESKQYGLEVTWPAPAPHTSIYPWLWLQEHSYDPPARPKLENATDPEKVLWGSNIAQNPPTVTFEEAMTDQGLFEWLSKVDKFGLCLITGVPPTTEGTEKLSERIGFIRETKYGKLWEMTADLAMGDTAYTNVALGAHTDNTYFTDPSGLQLLHVLSHTGGTGGKTLLVDGFHVAATLKERHPESYTLLSTVPIPAHAAGDDGGIYQASPKSGYPTLSHDLVTRELYQVRWNNNDRSVMDHLDPKIVEEWYEAIRIWNRLLKSADSEYWVQLSPGTALIVNNHRVLHGRSSFTGRRWVCGSYIVFDEFKSKLAVLKERFDPDRVTADTRDPSSGSSVWSPAL
ncbi:hypothetical protein BJ322DRAFT_1098315 [Thelephora terrestris]|uniref:trimethyllysine dioxygenase n=1 Tax=Thelephora terrestris TaxID=56493 RepID=A0A9P6LBA5_9AGAM|nr:hypothetical protein BJ322DRAFT_1098315 [Thelephora terrestris]